MRPVLLALALLLLPCASAQLKPTRRSIQNGRHFYDFDYTLPE